MHNDSRFAYETLMRGLMNTNDMIKQAKRDLEENPSKRVEVVLESGGRLLGDWIDFGKRDTAELYTDTGTTVGSVTIDLVKVVAIGTFIDAGQSDDVTGILVSPRMRDMTIASIIAQALTREDTAITVDMLEQMARQSKDEDLVRAVGAITDPALTSESRERLASLPIDLIDPRHSTIVYRTLLASLTSPMAIDDRFARPEEMVPLLSGVVDVIHSKQFVRENAAAIAEGMADWPTLLATGEAGTDMEALKPRLRLGYIIKEARRLYRPFMAREQLLVEISALVRS